MRIFAFIILVFVLSKFPAQDIIFGSTLSTAANSLSAGESIKFTTTSLTTASLDPGTGISIIEWGNTGVWSTIENKIYIIGKEHSSTTGHYRLIYDEATNTWSRDQNVHNDMTGSAVGHSYDGMALNPATGNIYFRKYNTNTVFKWVRSTDTWSILSAVSGSIDIAEALEYWPGRGVIWSDVYSAQLYGGSSWSTLTTSISGIGYHSLGEVQPNADIYVFGGGNSGETKLYKLDTDDNLTTLGTAQVSLGNGGTSGQGILVYNPVDSNYIAWDRSNTWYEFDAVNDNWSSITQSSGDGSSAQTGAPNYSEGGSIAVPISDYGVIMFFSDVSNDVWLYKHSSLSNSGSIIQTFDITSDTTATNPFTVGLGFKKGDVSNSFTLDITDYQVDSMKTWNDGSIKHAIVSGTVAMTANTAKTINVYSNGVRPSVTALAESDIVTAAPTATVQLGAYGTASLADLLGSPVRTFLAGQSCVESHYQKDVGDTLSVWFHVRLYSTDDVWIRVIVDNGVIDIASGNYIYTPTVIIDGDTVYNTQITHYAHTRWTAEGWVGSTGPEIYIEHDTEYLQSSALVPNYFANTPSASALNGLDTSYTPMQQGGWTADMGGTGFQNQIGLLANWDALYLTSGGDRRAFKAMVANSQSIGSYPIIWADSSTDAPIEITEWSTWTVNGAGGGGETSIEIGGLTWDIAHHGSAGYLAYLLTGDYFHLETMQYQSTLCYLFTSSVYGNDTSRVLTPVQTRGVAWTNRTIGQYISITPFDTVSSELQSLFNQSIIYWDSIATQVGMNQIGYLYSYYWYDTGVIAPWQQHFWIQTFGMLSDIEPLASMTTFNSVRDTLYKAAVGILGPNGSDYYCFTKASIYNITVSDASDNAVNWYDSWGTVHLNTHSGANTSCDNTLEGTSGGAPASASTGYWGNLLPAIAYAVDDNATGANAAWGRLIGATNWSTITGSGFDDIPVWGIVPRNYTTSSNTSGNMKSGGTGKLTSGGTGSLR